MASLKFLSWNVEHFNGRGGLPPRGNSKDLRKLRRDRLKRVVDLIEDINPDVFGLIEVEGKMVFEAMTNAMPGYAFSITEGRQTQEILIGARSNLAPFFTQRPEFKRSNPHLRPGALLTVTRNGLKIPILFAHFKSTPSPEGFGLRDAMFDKVFSLKRSLDKASRRVNGQPAPFIVVGDMNTMGMDYVGKQHDIHRDAEVKEVSSMFARRKMRMLTKSHPNTYFDGSDSSYPPSDLDHVYAARHLTFSKLANGAEVRVAGWAEESTPARQDKWIERFSDHAPLIFRLTGI